MSLDPDDGPCGCGGRGCPSCTTSMPNMEKKEPIQQYDCKGGFIPEMQNKTDRCSCEKYKHSMPQIDGAQGLAYVHGVVYTGSVFEYCPFCGDKLKPIFKQTTAGG